MPQFEGFVRLILPPLDLSIDFFMIQELAVLTEALKMNCGQMLGFVRRSCDFELRQTQIL